MNFVLKLFISLLSINSFANSFEQTMNWINNQKPTTGVFNELRKFKDLPDSYITQLPFIVREKISNQAKNLILNAANSGSCESSDKVTFPFSKSNPELNEKINDFQNSLVNVETIFCIPNVKSINVFETFLDENYQKNAFSGVTYFKQIQNRICQKLQIPFVGESNFCYTNSIFQENNNYFLHSYVDYNAAGVSAPSYFREFFAGFINLPNGTLYYGNIYFRGIDLNPFTKKAAALTIKTNNAKALNDLLLLSTKKQNN